MATPKKKHLIELMIEANVKWPDDAEYATQDKSTCKVHFYKGGKPVRSKVNTEAWSDAVSACTWMGGELSIELSSLCSNWHQTIVTREQYEQALSNTTVTAEVQIESDHCEPVVSQVPNRTIEQFTDDYYAKVAEAKHLQAAANKALKLADEALVALQKAGESIGLVISVDSTQKPTEQHQQPVITDWRDLKVGDIIECTPYTDRTNTAWPGGWASQNIGTQQVISKIDNVKGRIIIKDNKDSGYAFKFIRRP